jgi:AraC-like DNA-binding protein
MVTNNIILILASLGLFQALFLCFYLFTLKKGNRKSNIFLALVLLGLTIRVGKSVLNYYIPLDAWQRNIGIAGILFAAPCLWFYGITLLEKNKAFSSWNYIHLLPFLLFVSLLHRIPSAGEFASYWNYGLVTFHLLIYLLLSWVYLYKKRLQSSASILVWYRNILIGVTLVWFYYVGNFFKFTPHYIAGPLFYTFLIYAFSYLFLNRHHFSLEKYGNSTLDRNVSRDIFQKVKTLFTAERIFLDPGLSLNSVAEKLALSPRVLSRVINENEHRNFYEFVNLYRVESAKGLLTDPTHNKEKIATIAYDAGFGTVTAFNVAFKKITGMTPSEYRKRGLLV